MPQRLPVLDLASIDLRDLRDRPLLDHTKAAELAVLFKILGSDARLRLIHALDLAGELSVTDLATTLGMTPQAVSNQLSRLVDRRVLGARRQGNNVYYRITDPCVPHLLVLGLCLTETPASTTPAPPEEPP